MTMQEPGSAELMTWLHDQIAQLKTQMSRMQQQHDQIQASLADVNDSLHDAESKVREMTARTIGLPVMQEQMR